MQACRVAELRCLGYPRIDDGCQCRAQGERQILGLEAVRRARATDGLARQALERKRVGIAVDLYSVTAMRLTEVLPLRQRV